MKFKIIVDSSSNLKNSDFRNENIDFSVVPLTIRIDDKEYIDDDNLDVKEMLNNMEKSKTKSSTSCPSPSQFLNELEGSEYYFIFTISKKLSGVFNSATVAREMSSNKENIVVIDSLLTSGAIELLVRETIKEIKDNKSFEEIKNNLENFKKNIYLFFVLDKFDNLVKNGRINKALAFIANLANIKPLCVGEDGEIKIKEKIRSLQGVYKRIVAYIKSVCDDVSNRILIISHTECRENAEILKKIIEENYNFKEIIIKENKGLCSFYSERGGIICTF